MTEASLIFDLNVERWLDYQEGVKGRLRHDLIWGNIQQHLPPVESKIRVLDVGCGLGDIATLLFDRSDKLVLLDFSTRMLEETKRRLEANNPSFDPEKVTFIHGDVEESLSRLSKDPFDLIICHNILEYIEAPWAILASLARMVVPGGLLSLVAANCFSDPLKKALAKFDFEGARLALNRRDSTADLFDSTPKRTFSLEELDGAISDSGFKIAARYGIRVFADYLPEAVVQQPGTYSNLLELEKEAASQLPYINMARYIQLICRK